MRRLSFHFKLFDLTVSEEGGALVSVGWGWGGAQDYTPLLCRAGKQIQDYLEGKRSTFDLPLRPLGTPFQQRVWKAIKEIPFGQAVSYACLAKRINSSPRPVGAACGANPLPIIIPCHRVVASNLGLGGYSGAGGLDTKQMLLDIEGYRGV